MPSRERTIVGVGLGAASDSDPREPSLAIDLVAKKPPSTRPPLAPDEPVAAEPETAATEGATDTAPAAMATERDIAPPHVTPEAAPATSAPDPAPIPMSRRLPSEPERVEANIEREASELPALPRRSGTGWLLLLLLIASGVAGYAFRDRLLPFWYIAVKAIDRRLH